MLDFSEGQGQLDLKSYVERESIASIDLKFCDLVGAWRHMTIPADAIPKDDFKGGIGVDGSSIPQFADVNKGDICIIPDMSKGFIDNVSGLIKLIY